MRKTLWWVLGAVILLALPSALWAAPSYIGMSGLIFTPDDLILSPGTVRPAYNAILIDSEGHTRTRNLFSVTAGLGTGLEVGAAVIDKNLTGGSTKTIFNAKYQVNEETALKPAITVGVVDVTNALDDLNDVSSPGFFILLSKTFDPTSGEMNGRSMPLKAHLGLGSGIYNGLFVGLDWALDPRISVVAEYTRRGIAVGQDDVISFGGKVKITDQITGDISVIDNRRLGFGLSFTTVEF